MPFDVKLRVNLVISVLWIFRMNSQIKNQLDIANTHLKQGDFEQAVYLFQDAVNRSTTSVQARAGLAKALLRLNRSDEAVEHLLTALEYSPDNADISYNLGVAYHRQGKYHSAIECYAAVSDSDAESPGDLHFNLGNAYQEMGKFHDAINSYRKALDIRPHDIDALKNLAVAYQRVNRDADARDCYERLNQIREG